ncbi:hypothetical protein FRX31_009619 [Thalictrum thalictroides]|uniref:Transmembrane protein n=1 Tax=Thalictrum thalictroides TaxID=46969 RepID=A0A7J6WW93_THATH|nr:hypothetical protein FRX31_009619 [Thalictrum thalictroides]
MLFVAGVMVLSIVTVLAFGWMAVSIMTEGSASQENGDDGNDVNTPLINPTGTSQSSCFYVLPITLLCNT